MERVCVQTLNLNFVRLTSVYVRRYVYHCSFFKASACELAHIHSSVASNGRILTLNPCEQIEYILHQHNRNIEGIVVAEMNWSAGIGMLPP